MNSAALLLAALGCGPPVIDFTFDSSADSDARIDSDGGTTGGDDTTDSAVSDDSDDSGTAPPWLAEPLGTGEARAGVVTDARELFGGVAAEGQLGDIKLYNDRARFILQAPRVGHHVSDAAGHIVDADVVRSGAEAPGRDMVEEWLSMVGIAHVLRAESVEVVDDGAASGRAVVVVEGADAPLTYLSGILEDPDFIPPLGLRFRTEYTLPADSPLMEVTTTLTASADVRLEPGEILLGAVDAGRPWSPGAGAGEPLASAGWYGFISDRGEGALAVMAPPGEVLMPLPGVDLFTDLLTLASAFRESVELPAGGELTVRRYYGVGPDLAALTDAWMGLTDIALAAADGQVTAPDGPVAGARVTVLTDGEPFTVAVTDADGAFASAVPVGPVVSYIADGRGVGLHADLPDGAGRYSPYAVAEVQALALDSLASGAPPIAAAQGRGISDGLTLGEPATLTVSSDDGAPFELRLLFAGGDPVEADPALHLPRPDAECPDCAAIAWARDGEVRLPVEPGDYTLVAWRGIRHELYTVDLRLEPGEDRDVTASLREAYPTPGWLLADLHAHAAPSSDGGLPMSYRLTASAAVGLDVLLGSDHDHVVDYAPLLAPLGLSLRTVTADEVSSVIRGHLNLYPLSAAPAAMNGGAWIWWEQVFSDTAEMTDQLRAHAPEALIQVNHPLNGLADAAEWSPGQIGDGSRWSEDFDAVEVLSGGSLDALDFYLDLSSRGVLAAPVGVSDSHTATGGDPGLSATWVQLDPADFSPEAFAEAVKGRRTQVTRGPFLKFSRDLGETIEAGATLEVAALSPSWMTVERLSLVKDGVVVEEIAGTEGVFVLDAAADAVFVVLASGDAAMAPISTRTPWAMSAPILVDVAGDGWEAPLAPLVIGE